MKRNRVKTEEYIECDGCDYVIGLSRKERDQGMDVCAAMTVLRIPSENSYGPSDHDGFLEFHFHGPNGSRPDCFRYWAHNQYIMERSLYNRKWGQDQIDAFLATHLYRGNKVTA